MQFRTKISPYCINILYLHDYFIKSVYNVQNCMTHYNVGLLGILTRVFNLNQIGLTIIASTPSAND